MTGSLIAAMALAVPGPQATTYFSGMRRPLAAQVDLTADAGPVILIVVDAMRPDRLTPYGSTNDTTPNLKRLADEGVTFTNYFVNGNWTRPSVASLLTGLYPAQHGVERDSDRLDSRVPTLPETLGRAGVPTGAVVGNGNAGSAYGLGRGFAFYADTVRNWKGLPTADEVTNLGLPFVRQNVGRPFFLMLFLVDPHDPYHAPEPFESMFVTDPKVPLVRSPHWEKDRYPPASIHRMLATYDGVLRFTDAALGRFFEELKALKVYDRATIIVTADHGEAFGEHGVFLHAYHMYDEIIRAPLIIKPARTSTPGVANDQMLQAVDLFPTIAATMHARTAPGLPGREIAALVQSTAAADRDRPILCEFNNYGISRRAIRTRDRKVILADPADRAQFLASVGRPSLLPSVSFTEERISMYDLRVDPFERHDLYRPQGPSPGPEWDGLLRLLREHAGMVRRSAPAKEKPVLDPGTLRNLRSLGYIQ